MGKDRGVFLSSEEYLRLTEIEKEIYLVLSRERSRVLLSKHLKKEGAECPDWGLERSLQHGRCEEGFGRNEENPAINKPSAS